MGSQQGENSGRFLVVREICWPWGSHGDKELFSVLGVIPEDRHEGHSSTGNGHSAPPQRWPSLKILVTLFSSSSIFLPVFFKHP